ncbi:hypothetical protein Aspvir_001166 [Aspergillus viridinutans]|uniref:Uncharacterized protein n=1 Tax=Aspergillus viridinutans TaxID=75553 RepID=A0A9P3BR33_ASPVI|nr:uncharacterized protein Aspvir_001166 [Aspergillus viridinutans]GIJ99042.1 hypothetical protein Aspvir_001166 [Aspergillus viridinutans]
MALTYLAIHRLFETYLSARAMGSLDYAAVIATAVRELENTDKNLDSLEGGLLEVRRLVMQAHDKVVRSPEISKMQASQCKRVLELGRKIIHSHDTVLSMSPEIRELHAAQCTLTPERRQTFVCEEESQTAVGEDGNRYRRELEGQRSLQDYAGVGL